MKLLRSLMLSSLALLAMIGAATAQGTQPKAPLTNSSIIKLVRAGFKEKTIISIIASSPASFDVSPDQMIELKRNGVSEKIILEMVNRQEDAGFMSDNWPDAPLINETANNQKQNQKNGSSSDVFGSSGSASSETRTRGGTASSSGDTETMGSATVRIIRPPSEAGDGLKLEKSPPLTNDSIIELVEAGFSEGTIIRRIERSPVDFNLSPEKLAELRKHRVSDKIIDAMKAATGGDTNSNKTGPGSNGMAKPQ
jgi:hypothetical protein